FKFFYIFKLIFFKKKEFVITKNLVLLLANPVYSILISGMIGEVLRGEADIAVADLTINSNRELAVDFTYPFMATGISIIYKRPTTKETSLWSFLSPFSTIVWIYLMTAFAGISVVLFCIGRFSPYEWTNP